MTTTPGLQIQIRQDYIGDPLKQINFQAQKIQLKLACYTGVAII